jgi:hypothetical protein
VQSATRHRLVLQLVLWSFDMCRSNGFPIRADLLSDAAKTLSYVETALLPLLASMEAAGCGGGRCLIEIINEPVRARTLTRTQHRGSLHPSTLAPRTSLE